MLFLCLFYLIYIIASSANLSFAFACALLRFWRYSPSILLNLSFAFTEISSSQRLHGEGSASRRRALAVAITSLRQLVESKGVLQSIHKYASVNPQIRFRKSSKALLSIPKSDASKALSYPSVPMSLCPYVPLSPCPFSLQIETAVANIIA